ncbi:unnamed protein product [Porites lobata]|uniref:Uncharacterized protein n=1 Tax=Porites lobata TaxID=104759 RepID=A0ABN8QNF1_9CNID|nr:unnamed protein product [Porites lobata]
MTCKLVSGVSMRLLEVDLFSGNQFSHLPVTGGRRKNKVNQSSSLWPATLTHVPVIMICAQTTLELKKRFQVINFIQAL